MFQQIIDSVIQCAFERSQETQNIVDRHSIRFGITDDPRVRAQRRLSNGQNLVEVNIHFVEGLWILSYVFSMINDIAVRNNNQIVENEETNQLLEMLNWVFRNRLLAYRNAEWPDHFPRPRAGDERESKTWIASQVCLRVVSFILHHEIAHARHEDEAPAIVGDDQSMLNEFNADESAFDYILSMHPDNTSNEYFMRVLGIVVAYCSMIFIEAQTRERLFGTHPLSWNRLNRFLHRYCDDDMATWHLCSIIIGGTLMPNYSRTEYDTTREFDDPRQAVDYCFECLTAAMR